MRMTIHKRTRILLGVSLPIAAIVAFVGFLLLNPERGCNLLLKLGVSSERVGSIYGRDAYIQRRLGEYHLGGEGDYDVVRAQSFFLRAIALNPTSPYVHYQLSRTYFLNSRYAKALTEVNKEILYNPDFSRSYYLRGLIHGYNGDYTRAAHDFAKFTTLEPEEWAGYVDLAWMLFQLGEYEEIVERMEIILQKTRNAWILNAYGVALLNLGRLDAAKDAFLEAQNLASRMTPEAWGVAYVGNDPHIYAMGLEEMKRNIDENIERVNNALSE